jgi:hypothetical protein
LSVRARVLFLLLAVGGMAAGQEAQEASPAADRVAHALMQDTLVQAERWLLEMFVQPGTDVPTLVLKDFEKLDAAVQESSFRDLAQRSGMLLFVTREQVRLVQERRRAAETAQRLMRESQLDRRRERRRRATATLFWASFGAALAGFAGSYACWFASGQLDNVNTPLSDALEIASYAGAGIGAAGVTIALPALAGLRSR